MEQDRLLDETLTTQGPASYYSVQEKKCDKVLSRCVTPLWCGKYEDLQHNAWTQEGVSAQPSGVSAPPPGLVPSADFCPIMQVTNEDPKQDWIQY